MNEIFEALICFLINMADILLETRQQIEQYQESLKHLKVSLEDYSEIASFGQGSYGQVKLYSHKKTHQLVAIKFLLNVSDKIQKIYSQLTFFREVELTQQLTLPTVVPFIGCNYPVSGSDRNDHIFITEFQENGSLATLFSKLKENKMYNEQWFKTKRAIIAFGIAVGFMTIHHKGIIHRDLKPENILLNNKFEPQIADFGGARRNDTIAKTTQVGTPKYAAPELLDSDKSHYSFPVDVYSYCLIMIQLYTFEELYPELNSMKIEAMVRNGQHPDIPANTTESMKQLIDAGLALSATNRPTFSDFVENYVQNITAFFDGIDVDEFNKYKDKVFTEVLSPPEEVENTVEVNNDQVILIAPPNLFTSSISDGNYTTEQGDDYEDESYEDKDNFDKVRRAQYLLLSQNENQDEDERDYEIPFELFNEVAEEESNEAYLGYACLVTGYMLYNSIGCEEDQDKALDYFEKAVNKGYPVAYYFYGKLQPTEEQQLTILTQGQDLFKEPNCIYQIGFIYEKQNNPKKAREYYRQAAKLFQDDANYKLGLYYYKKHNYDKAVSYFTRAIDISNHLLSRMKYAKMLEQGLGVHLNLEEAKRIYQSIAQSCNDNNKKTKARIRTAHLSYQINSSIKIKDNSRKTLEKFNNREAKYYLYELTLDDDKETANQYLEEAIQASYPKALYQAAVKEANSNDFENAKAHLKAAVEKGLPEAMILLGDLNFQGKLKSSKKPHSQQEPKHKRAVYYYNKAAKRNYMEGYHKLAMVYKAIGNNDLYLESIKKAHEFGLKNATFEYANYLLSQHKISETINILSKCKEPDDQLILLYAESLYRGKQFFDFDYIIDSLIQRELPEALCMKATVLKLQNPHKKSEAENFEDVKSLYEKAVTKQFYPAYAHLGQLLLEHGEIEQGLKLLTESYENKSSDGAYYYGLHLFKKDKEKCLSLINEAAQQNHPDALKFLSDLYMKGESVPKDEEKARHYLQLYQRYNKEPVDLDQKHVSPKIADLIQQAFSRKKQNAEVLLEIGRMYLNGTDCEKNVSEALNYLRLAAHNKNPEAQFEYAKLLIEGTGNETSPEMGYDWMKRAAEKSKYQPAIDYLQSMSY